MLVQVLLSMIYSIERNKAPVNYRNKIRGLCGEGNKKWNAVLAVKARLSHSIDGVTGALV